MPSTWLTAEDRALPACFSLGKRARPGSIGIQDGGRAPARRGGKATLEAQAFGDRISSLTPSPGYNSRL